MESHADDEPQVVHMLALDSDGEAHDEEHAMLDLTEELMLMHARESMGSNCVLPPPPDAAPLFVVPPPPPDTEPLFVGSPGMNDSLMGDAFIFDSEEDTEATRNENHVIPVINGDTSKHDEPVERDTLSPLPQICRTSSRQSSTGNISHKEDELEGSPSFSNRHSGRSREPSPAVSDRKSPQSIMDNQRTPLSASSSQVESPKLYVETNRRNTAPPVIPVLPMSQSAPTTIPNGNTSVIMETPPAYQQRPCESSKVIRSSSRGLIWGMSRPVFLILAFYLLFVTAALAYFVAQYVESSSLKDEVDRLEEQVDRLQIQNEELQSLILKLNSTIDDLSGELDMDTLSVENEKLKQSNLLLEEENEALSSLVDELQNQTDFLQATFGNLTVENEELKETVLELQQANEVAVNLTQSLNETNTELAELVETLNATNIELENLTQSLGTIVSFLDETSQGSDLTYEQLMGQLEEQITINRRLVLGQLQNTFLQRTQLWSCDYRNTFSGATFVESFNEPVGSANYESVMSYVQNSVLTDLCLNRTDFETYLTIDFAQNGVVSPVEITSNQLTEGVSNYTGDVLNYYFPTGDETGLTPQDWADASYTCVNLPADKQFMFVI
jgi:hypothetical protein